ncbi:hypothetical protein [uncultured Meiothermus sp.]|jgi:uncharacterized repeat protein (TIGR01451 family)|uniref:DUF7933 domain-containing protein n=1 Tax=uncultured Meiothermus sp. TaxID=157471 RepID=UPI0026333EFA|nr:hypothetical protein [uncultured Meiothermus sp.]
MKTPVFFPGRWVKTMQNDTGKLVRIGLLVLASGLVHSATAQSINLPLSSVGSQVGWDQRAGALDDYRLAVFERAAGQPLRVELFSPDINLNDYRNKRDVQNYYGDEIYAPGAQMRSTFGLLNRGGPGALVQKQYGNAEVHRYDTLFEGSLVQGYYGLPVRTFGNGKNAFGFRLSPGIAVEASQFTVVTRGQLGRDQVAARLTLGQAAVGSVFRIENFDADGPQEMRIFVRFPNGQRRELTSSGDVQWARNEFRVTPELRGEWAILVRILPTTRQFSNSVKLRLRLDGQPYFARVPAEPGPALPRVEPPPPPPPAHRVDLAVNKSVSTPRVSLGETVTYTLTVVNNGPDAATDVVLTDTLPTGLSSPRTEGAVRSENLLTWRVGSLASGEQRTFTVQVAASAVGMLVNRAEVRAVEDETTLVNNRTDVRLEVVAPPPPPRQLEVDLAVTKMVEPARIETGQNATYTLSVRNNGPDVASRVVLTDRLPVGLEFVSANPVPSREGNTLTWNLGSLPSGESRSFSVVVRGRVAGQRTNQASVTSSERDRDQSNNQARVALEVVAPLPPPPPPHTPPEPRADLALSKTVSPAQASVGDRVTFILTLVNNGPDAATGVVLTDTLPAGLSNVTAEGAGLSNTTLTWNVGNLPSGTRRSFSVQATAAQAGTLLNHAQVRLTETDPNPGNNHAQARLSVAQPPAPPPPVVREPVRERESEVTLAAQLTLIPASGVVILSDRLPEGARYVLGSSRLLRGAVRQGELEQSVLANPTRENSDPIADPLVLGDRLFWVLPAPLRSSYTLGYRLTHSGALESPRDRLGVILQTPRTRSAGLPRTPGQQPVLGSLGDVRVLVGEPNLLEALVRAQPIQRSGLADLRTVQGGGAPETIQIYPSRPLTTDRSDQPELTIVIRDAQGNPANVGYVTVSVQPEPRLEDAEPSLPGYQVRVLHGEARLPLSHLGTRLQGGSPDGVQIEVTAGEVRKQARFPVEAAEPRPLIVSGAVGLQASLGSSGFSLESTLRAFGRGTVLGDGLFTGAVNTGADFSVNNGFLFRDVNLLPPANPYQRFPLLGDSSQVGTDVNSSDSVFLRFELEKNYLQYGQLSTDFQGLLTGYNAGYNGLKGVLREGSFGFNAFAALVPNANRREVIAGDGTSFYRLGLLPSERPVVSNSEQAARVVRDRNNPNLVLSRTILLRNADYEIDYTAGILQLRSPLQPTDLNGNPQSLEVAYAVSTASGIVRELRGGLQAGYDTETFGIKATLLSLDSSVSSLAGLGLRVGGPNARLEAEIATPISDLGRVAGAVRFGLKTQNFDLEGRYQDIPPGFQDPRGSPSAARDITLGTAARFGLFGLSGRYSLNQNYLAGTTTQQVSAEARAGDESLALLLGAGASFGLNPQSINNFQTDTAFVSLGTEARAGRFGIALRQLVGLGSTPGATDLSLDYTLTQNFGVRLQNRLTYAASGPRLTGALGVRGSFANDRLLRTLLGNASETPDPGAQGLGTTNISAAYEMSNLDGEAGRTRLGLDTALPLSKELQLGLSANATIASNAQGGASAGIALRYNGDTLQASGRAEVSGQASTPGFKQVYEFGLIYRPSPDLIVSPQATYVREAAGTDGTRFSLAGAYRGDRLSMLTQNVLKGGFYRDAGGVLFEGEVRGSYQADERWFLRLGAAYRLSDTGIFTGQLGGGFTYFFTDLVGLGASTSYLFQPATRSSQLSLGVEASLRVAAGLTFSVGANLLGTQTSLVGFQSQPGLYLRLDWLLDENLFGAPTR